MLLLNSNESVKRWSDTLSEASLYSQTIDYVENTAMEGLQNSRSSISLCPIFYFTVIRSKLTKHKGEQSYNA